MFLEHARFSIIKMTENLRRNDNMIAEPKESGFIRHGVKVLIGMRPPFKQNGCGRKMSKETRSTDHSITVFVSIARYLNGVCAYTFPTFGRYRVVSKIKI